MQTTLPLSQQEVGWIQTYVGAVVLTMPMLATKLTSNFGPTAPFKVAIGISALHLAGLLIAFKETLPKDERKKIAGTLCVVFAFLD